jgi:hypothetical protein
VPIAGDNPDPSIVPNDGTSIAGQFRVSGEPPVFRVRTLPRHGSMRVLRIVSESGGYRTLYDLVVDTRADEVATGAVRVTATPAARAGALEALDWSDLGPCDTERDGFAVPAGIRYAPLRIDYDVEPAFKLGEDGPMREPDETCVVSSRATWTAGGFVQENRTAPCSTTRFRAGYLRPDGSVEIRTTIHTGR